MSKKKVLIITNRSLKSAPRVIREVEALKHDFDLTVYGSGRLADSNVRTGDFDEELSVSFTDKVIRKLMLYLTKGSRIYLLPGWYGKLKRIIRSERPDIVVIHEPDLLPYINKVRKGAGFKLVYNAHEYHPREHEGNPVWLRTKGVYYKSLYGRYLKDVDLMINVCDSIAEECRQVYKKDSIVIPNAAPYFPEIKPSSSENEPIRIIHHGVTNRDRKLELMIKAVARFPDKFTLDLMLVSSNDPAYYEELVEMARQSKNINFVTPVSFHQIVPFISQYDVGLYFIAPTSFNNTVALPNKFFEFIQARLSLVVSPSKEMAQIVKKYDLGIVGSGFTEDEIVEALSNLSIEAVNGYKQNSDKVAYSLSAEKFNKCLLSEVLKINHIN